MTEKSLTRKAGDAAFWQLLGGGWTTVVRLVASALLARILTPSDFGTFGLALIVFEFISCLGAVGMGAAIVAKKLVSNQDLNTCFWSMLLLRIIMFVICIGIAPFAALFFENHLITDLLRVVAFTFLFSVLEIVPSAILSRNLNFRAVNIIQAVIVVLESVIAVSLALFTTMGFWSLVIAMLVSSLLTSISMAAYVGWWPKLNFSKESFNYLFKFGSNTLGFSLMNYLSQNLDYLLVGKMLGTRALGLYEFAYRIPHIVHMRVVQPIGSTLFPTLAKVQNDNEKLIFGFTRTMEFLALVSFPSLLGLASIADVVVPLLWGDQWLEIIVPLQLLCLCAALRVVPQAAGAVLLSKHRPDIPFKVSVISITWTTICISILGSLWGIVGVAVGMVFSTIPSYITVYFAFKLTEQSITARLKTLIPIVISTIFCSAGAFTVKQYMLSVDAPLYLNLIASVAFGAFVYITTLLVFFNNYSSQLVHTLESAIGFKLSNYTKWIFKSNTIKNGEAD